MNRRNFIQLAGAGALAGLTPEALAASRPSAQSRIVVLVELKGGNDGFNTLINGDDDQYYHHRKRIHIPKRRLVSLGNGYGMNPALKPLQSIWNAGDLAWIQGVGYPHGILSHFRSMDVWETASMGSGNTIGWLSRVLPHYKEGLHGIAISRDQGALGPLAGSRVNSIAMQNPRTFLSQARLVEDVTLNGSTPALAHITRTQKQLVSMGKQLVDKLDHRQINLPVRFSKGVLGHGLESVAKMILSGIDAPVYKVTQDGFDTHIGQMQPHESSLYKLGHGLNSFAEAMKRGGMWDNVLVVTYSEFGRRIVENKGQGTDHGTASAHLIMGGRVRRGIYGDHPNLHQLDSNNNVAHTTDFRSIYATLAQNWWRQPNPWRGHPILPMLA